MPDGLSDLKFLNNNALDWVAVIGDWCSEERSAADSGSFFSVYREFRCGEGLIRAKQLGAKKFGCSVDCNSCL